ncbi:putative S-adenosylmethionine decarboxylase proenzyme 4-like [Iris pallida]|uniref:S-adenosylmethionine decarboxylase proenzyme n=1 Tax=Iris pallida TaxID=29817 RepID=A0AAX6FJI2_IRIPA|nr:putative S-adenosylmethionine decarboxylase proenzyme 4-like [Iris pallida]
MAAVSGFEGFEKRLQLDFSPTGADADPLGLRGLSPATLRLVLDAVGCSIVSAAGNRHFDAYVLSESSLFVYPHRIIIKTCGTTQLLNSVPLLLRHAARLGGLRPSLCRYSRGSFIFPDAQPFPYSSFRHEVELLERALPAELAHRKASVVSSPGPHSSWHVYSAAAGYVSEERERELFTVEVCMTELDRGLASAFYRGDRRRWLSGDEAGREMTEGTGLGGVNPRSLALGFAFDPCGYSMNGLDRDRYSTVHVTPEEGYSYASFECVGGPWEEEGEETAAMLARAVRVFGPGSVSVSVSGGGGRSEAVWSAVESAVGAVGLECRTRAAEYFPGVGQVTYQTFAAARLQE